jgi:hypothetical protein
VKENSISFGWQNWPTWAGMAQGSCNGTISGINMSLECKEWIQSPSSGLLLNGTNTDKLTKESVAGLQITSVVHRPLYLHADYRRSSSDLDVLAQAIHSFTVQIVYMNMGTVRSGVASAELFLSRSGATRDILLGSARLGALNSFEVATASSVVGIDIKTPPGKYFLLACLGKECRRSAGQLVVTGSKATIRHPPIDNR